MSIVQNVATDITASQKAGDHRTLAALRLLRNALNTKAKDVRVAELTDEEAMKVLQSEAKKRRDSITAYQQGGRNDLVEAEQFELDLLAKYLPAQLTAEELQILIQTVVKEQQLVAPYDFGRLMGAVVKQAAGRADGQSIKQAVQKFIQT